LRQDQKLVIERGEAPALGMQQVFTSIGEMIESLRASGISASDAKAIAVRAKPYVQLECTSVQDEIEISLGVTKIGGRPDLPIGMEWPWRLPYPDHAQRLEDFRAAFEDFRADPPLDFEDFATPVRRAAEPAPLAFIAQADLAAVWRAGPLDPDIPREGRLLFFYDTVCLPDGDRAMDVSGARLIYDLTPASALKRAAPPEELSQLKRDGTFPPCRCVLRAALSPPAHLSADWNACSMVGKSDNAAEEWWYRHTNGGHDHRIGGHPLQIQGIDVQTQCVLASTGLKYNETNARSAKAEADDWLMLMQIASDPCARMMWGDVGDLYVMIRRDDLRARCFENARVILQGY
jgi:hypothetical protein